VALAANNNPPATSAYALRTLWLNWY
jgi:hypothetical protein